MTGAGPPRIGSLAVSTPHLIFMASTCERDGGDARAASGECAGRLVYRHRVHGLLGGAHRSPRADRRARRAVGLRPPALDPRGADDGAARADRKSVV